MILMKNNRALMERTSRTMRSRKTTCRDRLKSDDNEDAMRDVGGTDLVLVVVKYIYIYL